MSRASSRILTACALLAFPACADPPSRDEAPELPALDSQDSGAWPSPARLELTATIGVAEGADPYLLGRVAGIALSPEAVGVLDYSGPAVRLYDHAGVYLRDLGRPGQGPGELERPDALGFTGDGRVMIRDGTGTRIEVFSVDGTHLDSWRVDAAHARFSPGTKTVVTLDGAFLMASLRVAEQGDWQRVLWRYDGEARPAARSVPMIDVDTLKLPGIGVPFSPDEVFGLTPLGDYVVGGSGTYEFEIHRADGRGAVVRRAGVDPVPIREEERDWYRRYALYEVRRANDPGWVWDGPDVPEHKPSFMAFRGDTNGRVWVIRQGPGLRQGPCDENPETTLRKYPIERCWVDEPIIDVFDRDGTFLGSVETDDMAFLASRLGWIAVSGTVVAATGLTEDGVAQVRLYRLIIPATSGPREASE